MERASLPSQDDELDLYEGPATPDDDETFGPEPDDPRAAGTYEDAYEVPDYDPAHEEYGDCCEAVIG